MDQLIGLVLLRQVKPVRVILTHMPHTGPPILLVTPIQPIKW